MLISNIILEMFYSFFIMQDADKEHVTQAVGEPQILNWLQNEYNEANHPWTIGEKITEGIKVFQDTLYSWLPQSWREKDVNQDPNQISGVSGVVYRAGSKFKNNKWIRQRIGQALDLGLSFISWKNHPWVAWANGINQGINVLTHGRVNPRRVTYIGDAGGLKFVGKNVWWRGREWRKRLKYWNFGMASRLAYKDAIKYQWMYKYHNARFVQMINPKGLWDYYKNKWKWKFNKKFFPKWMGRTAYDILSIPRDVMIDQGAFAFRNYRQQYLGSPKHLWDMEQELIKIEKHRKQLWKNLGADDELTGELRRNKGIEQKEWLHGFMRIDRFSQPKMSWASVRANESPYHQRYVSKHSFGYFVKHDWGVGRTRGRKHKHLTYSNAPYYVGALDRMYEGQGRLAGYWNGRVSYDKLQKAWIASQPWYKRIKYKIYERNNDIRFYWKKYW
nr:hypothetical protein [Banfec virus 2]